MFIFEIFIAGKYDAIAEIIKEIIKIIKIELKFISLGNLSKKYISEGKNFKLNTVDKNILSFSILIENKIPKIIPLVVAKNRLSILSKKNFFN